MIDIAKQILSNIYTTIVVLLFLAFIVVKFNDVLKEFLKKKLNLNNAKLKSVSKKKTKYKIKIKNWLLIRIKDLLYFLSILGITILSFLFIPLSILGILYTFIKHIFFKRDYSISKQFGVIVRSIALINDALFNVSGGELLNDILKPKFAKYGKWYETVSAVTGVNQVKGDDKTFRKILDKGFGKRHCKEAITPEQKCFYKIKDESK